MSAKNSGCHGVLVRPETEGMRLGWTEIAPPLKAGVVVVDELAAPRGSFLWRSDWPAEGERQAVWEEAWREDNNTIRYISSHRPAVEVDAASGTITIEKASAGGFLYTLAGVGLVSLAQQHDVLVFHASAVQLDNKATVICAQSGSGKSSLLLALARAGWSTLSDDNCSIYRDGSEYTIWPGPEWLRLASGNVPPDLSPRFSLAWKEAWDLEPWHSHFPARVERIVVMQPAGGAAPEWQPLTPAEAVPLLSEHAVWLLAPQDCPLILFPQIVALATKVPAYRMRLPVSSRWTEQAVSLLSQTP